MSKAPPIIKLEDFTESINMCVYGDSGIGKTVFAGTAPNALFLAIERGTISASRQGSKADLWPIDGWDDLQEAYDWLSDNPDAYDWVIIDSATEMQSICMRHILDQAVAENPKRDPDIPALQDWQKYYNMFERMVAAFNALPINMLYTALTLRSDSEEGEDIVLPAIQGKGYLKAQLFAASMDITAYYQKVMTGKSEEAESKRRMLFESSAPYFGKDRYGVFPRWVTITEGDKQKATMVDLIKRINSPVAVKGKAAPTTTRKAPAKRRKTA